ncbi:MAG: pilin [Deltaproteobacteria bacterium]|nr:pilin [Deltaproteobacteria bacterium]
MHGCSGPAQGGFTLIELMVVIVIISVLATIAVPMFESRDRTDRVVGAATAVSNSFAAARARALRTSAAHRIILHRTATDSTLNVRVDESPDSSCNGFVTIAAHPVTPDGNEADPSNPCSSWLPSMQHRCGVMEVALTGRNVAWGGYLETGVVLTAVQEGTTGGAWTPRDDVVLCMNSRGRLLRADGAGGWTGVGGGIRLTLDRHSGAAELGVIKVVYVPQGGIVEDLR